MLDHHMHVIWTYYLSQFERPSLGLNKMTKEPYLISSWINQHGKLGVDIMP